MGTPKENSQETLFEKIGGRSSVEQMVTAFYQRVLADPLLMPFFEDKDVERLQRMQVTFFTIALSGIEPDGMTSLRQVHQGLGIEIKHLTRFTELLIETLEEVGVPESEAKKVYERIATFSNEILGDTNVDG